MCFFGGLNIDSNVCLGSVFDDGFLWLENRWKGVFLVNLGVGNVIGEKNGDWFEIGMGYFDLMLKGK